MEGSYWVALGSACGVALLFGIAIVRHSQYNRVLEVIKMISTGDIASARTTLGPFVESHDRDELLARDSVDAIRALSSLMWGFTVVNATRKSLPDWAWGPGKLLENSIGPLAAYWIANGQRVIDHMDASVSIDTLTGINELRQAWSLEGKMLRPS